MTDRRKMAEYLVDTNIFIAILKGDAKLKLFVESLACALDTTVYAELIQGSKNKAEVQKIEKYLTRFELVHFDNNVSTRTLELLRTYPKSHNLMFGDAIIAAVCLENDLTLLTYNVKDFHFIKNQPAAHFVADGGRDGLYFSPIDQTARRCRAGRVRIYLGRRLDAA
jgi:predicted nucleic acid-binding protein